MSSDSLKDRGRALEESFFHQRDKQLLETMRTKLAAQERKDALQASCGIRDESVLQELIDHNIDAETIIALSLYPLVVVAWADGKIQTEERDAILKAAADDGLSPGDHSHALIQSWLDEQPSDEMLTVWKDYVGGLKKSLSGEAMQHIQRQVIGRAQRVAEAAGGIMGLGSKVSASESAVLDDLRGTFG